MPGTAEEVAKNLTAGNRLLPYIQFNNTTPYSADYPYWVSEWSFEADGSYKFYRMPGGNKLWDMSSVCPSVRSWQYYFIYHFSRAVKQCNFRGLYHDGNGGGPCRNPAHGHSYVTYAGERRGFEYTFLGWREMAKRVYKMGKAHDPDFLIFWHSSGPKDMPVLAFCDAIILGEDFTGQLSREHPDYTHVMSLDKFRAGVMGHNFGPVGVFLTSFTRSPTPWQGKRPSEMPLEPVEHILGMAILHDCYLWPGWANLEPIKRS